MPTANTIQPLLGNNKAVFTYAMYSTYVKQKKRVVEPTRKVVAADTGTYRLGRHGRGGAEAGPPTPPPTPPPLKPGIRDRERWEEDTERGRYLLSTYCKRCFTGQNDKYSACLEGGS